MPQKLLDTFDVQREWRRHGYLQNFDSDYVSGDGWTAVATDDGTATLLDIVGGGLSLAPSDGTVADNDEIYLKRTRETFKFLANKPLELGARIQYVEGDADDLNVAFGLADAVAANTILDNGGGLKASFSGAAFYKVDGGTRWNFITSIGSNRVVTALDHGAGGANDQTFKIDVRPIDGATVEVIPLIDPLGGQNFAQCVDLQGRPVKHVLAVAGATEMQPFFGAKNGAAATVEALVVKQSYCFQLR